MTEIQEIGEFYEVDAAGHVVNPCALDNVPLHLRALIKDIGIQYRMHLGMNLMGLYLRGSVPAGKAIPGVSDLDVLGLMRWNPYQQFLRWERPSFADEMDEALRHHFQTLTHIDHAIAHHDPDFPGRNLSVKMVLKTQSICIWGQDVIPDIPPFKIGKDLCIHQKWVGPILDTWTDVQDEWPSQAEKVDFIRSCTKTLIRSGFELVMEKEGRFTQDLYPCYATFAKHFPAKAEAMRQVLLLFLNAAALHNQADRILQAIGPWLRQEIEFRS
ncbi:MAG TPA: hypothetical protein VHS96_03065 [Bacteroidia bacterium]|nr:hypothetical protein [Bacteroidia bacterium]